MSNFNIQEELFVWPGLAREPLAVAYGSNANMSGIRVGILCLRAPTRMCCFSVNSRFPSASLSACTKATEQETCRSCGSVPVHRRLLKTFGCISPWLLLRWNRGQNQPENFSSISIFIFLSDILCNTESCANRLEKIRREPKWTFHWKVWKDSVNFVLSIIRNFRLSFHLWYLARAGAVPKQKKHCARVCNCTSQFDLGQLNTITVTQ